MRFGFVGAGKVGCSLGKYLVYRKADVTGYYSRSYASAAWAAGYTQTTAFESLSELTDRCDAMFLTLPDDELASVFDELKAVMEKPMILIHCSGLLSSRIFQGSSGFSFYGYSIHPLLAVSSKETSCQEISKAVFTIEGHSKYLQELTELFRSFGNEVVCITPEEKPLYHAAAVMASNLMVALLDQSMQMMMQCGFSSGQAEKALEPLIKTNVEHILKDGCVAALTGPVERADVSTIRSHLGALPGKERNTYLILSRELLSLARKKHPERDYSQVEKLLEGEEDR